MIEDKKIENLFRDNQHKLDEMPPSMVWDKLEVRLEKRHVNHRLFAWQRLTIAAAVVIAVSMIGVWMYIDPLGGMDKTSPLFVEKELASEIIASDAPTPARPILMSHREKVQYLDEISKTRMNTRPALALAEEKTKQKITNVSPAKSLRAKAVKPVPQAEAAPSISTTDMALEAEIESRIEREMIEKIAKENIITIGNATEKEDNSDKALGDEIAANQAVVTTPTPPTLTTTSTTAGYTTVTYSVDDAETAPQDNVEAEEDDIVVVEEATTKETKKTRKAKRSADKATATKDVRSGSISGAAAKPTTKSEPELDRFDWLLGKWTDEDDNSFEEWQRIAPNILEGKGYFVVDVDTTFTQSMKIVHSNTQVFFMVNGQLVEGKFELEHYDERNAVFKNKAAANEQITLKKDANNGYSVTIEKSKKQAARERKKKKRTFKRVNE